MVMDHRHPHQRHRHHHNHHNLKMNLLIISYFYRIYRTKQRRWCYQCYSKSTYTQPAKSLKINTGGGSFCRIGIRNAMPYSQKYTPPQCFFCKFAGWVMFTLYPPSFYVRIFFIRLVYFSHLNFLWLSDESEKLHYERSWKFCNFYDYGLWKTAEITPESPGISVGCNAMLFSKLLCSCC